MAASISTDDRVDGTDIEAVFVDADVDFVRRGVIVCVTDVVLEITGSADEEWVLDVVVFSFLAFFVCTDFEILGELICADVLDSAVNRLVEVVMAADVFSHCR